MTHPRHKDSQSPVSILKSPITIYFDWILAIALFACAFALYARTMAPGLLDGDEGEFQTNIYLLGVSHTGYPLFFLLGKLWTLVVPIGTIAMRANLFSAFWGAVAVAAVFAFIRFLTNNSWAAIISASLFAVSRVEWSQAIIPRVYTMNAFFVVLVTYLFFRWRVGEVDLTVPVFAFGLSLTNHRTMLWFAPAIAIFVLWRERAVLFKPRRLISLAIAFLLPLLLYAYVFWRGESDVGVEFHWKDFNDMILGGNVRTWLRYNSLDWFIRRVTDLYIPLLIEQFSVAGLVAGIIGMITLASDRPPRGWLAALPARESFVFIFLANLASLAFGVIFWVIDIDKFLLPCFITFLFFVGVGIATVWDWLGEICNQLHLHRTQVQVSVTSHQLLLRIGYGLVSAVFLAAIINLAMKNYPLNDLSARTDIAETWRENLSQPLERNALIVGSWESLTPLEYSMYVDGKRRDLERWKVIVKKYQLGLVPYDSRQEDIERAVRAGRAVYLTSHPSDIETLTVLADEFRFARVGELWRAVNLAPNAVAPQGKPLTVFSDSQARRLELLGASIFPAARIRAGDFVLVTLFWRAPESLSARYTVSLRLTDAQDRVVAQRDTEPGSGRLATIGWTRGEIIQDDAGLIVPPELLPGIYQIQIVVYNGATGENLIPESSSHEIFNVGELVIDAN